MRRRWRSPRQPPGERLQWRSEVGPRPGRAPTPPPLPPPLETPAPPGPSAFGERREGRAPAPPERREPAGEGQLVPLEPLVSVLDGSALAALPVEPSAPEQASALATGEGATVEEPSSTAAEEPRQRRASRPPAATMRARIGLLIGDRKKYVVAIVFLSILAGLTEAATLALIAALATTLVRANHASAAHHATLSVFNFHQSTGTLILIGFGLCALRILFQVPLATLSARIAADVQARLRVELFDAFNRASWSIQSRDREGQLQEVMTSQVMQSVQGAVNTTSLISSGLQFLVLMAAGFLLNPFAALIVGVLSIALFALLRPMRAAGGRNAKGLSRAQLRFAGGIAESNRVAEESHVFGAGAAQRGAINALIEQSQGFFYRSQVLLRLVTSFYQTLILLLIVGGIGVLYLVGGSHAGALGGVIFVLIRAGSIGQVVQGAYQSLIQALPFIERTQKTLERYSAGVERYGSEPLATISSISFAHVGFAYKEDTPTLTDISFAVQGGEAIGIVGPSGAGKSTIVQLLLRLRDPVSGRYLVNGRDAAGFRGEDWHKQVSYVPQDPRLLHASVAENIRFFRDIPLDELERAARLARIHDDIMSWSGGYDAIVGPRADAVSGGQQQRICLARALAARPSMLVLDEPTSALDPQSEALIAESLYTIRQDLTLFIVAHRMSTLEMCDRVMVIVGGRLVGLDTRAELNRSNDYYRNASNLTIAGSAG